MLRSKLFHVISLGLFVLGLLVECSAADWPQWRYDARRSARSPEVLPDRLHLQWQRDYKPLKPAFWQVRQERVQFDLGYEPVVAGKTLLIGSSWNDRVTALDTETGNERWRFYADGPVRLAPAVWQDKVYFASDDGCLYCLDVERGNLLWKRRAAPSQRKVMGASFVPSLPVRIEPPMSYSPGLTRITSPGPALERAALIAPGLSARISAAGAALTKSPSEATAARASVLIAGPSYERGAGRFSRACPFARRRRA